MGRAINSFLVHLIFEPSVEELIENELIHNRYNFLITAFLFINETAYMYFVPKKTTDINDL